MTLTRGATITTKAAPVGGSTNFNITPHTTDAGTDCLIVVVWWVQVTTTTVSTITWNGVSLTAVPSSTATQSGVAKIQWYYLLAPTIQSSSTVTVTMSAASKGGAIALNYSGVHQTTPFGTAATNTNGATNVTPTVTLTSALTELVLAAAACNNGDTTTITAGAGQTDLANYIGAAGAAANSGRVLVSEEAGAATVVMDGTLSTNRLWAASGFSIKPAVATYPTFTEDILRVEV